MKLLVGLGNPGTKYEETRHNLGFRIVTDFQKRYPDMYPDFIEQKKFTAMLSEGNFKGEKIIIAMPLTYMNLSGQSVARLKNFYQLPLSDIWVVHDDLDLEPGNSKISFSVSSAGHNGITSIIQELGSNEFYRFRIGIGRPLPEMLEEYVLKRPKKSEQKLITAACEKTLSGLESALTDGIEKAQNLFNQK